MPNLGTNGFCLQPEWADGSDRGDLSSYFLLLAFSFSGAGLLADSEGDCIKNANCYRQKANELRMMSDAEYEKRVKMQQIMTVGKFAFKLGKAMFGGN